VKEGIMPKELGAWLRQQRQARGWSRPEMARRLIDIGHGKGDKAVPGPDSMYHNLYRWERGTDAPSERYKLYFCKAFGIPASHFGQAQPNALPAAGQPPGTFTLSIAPALPAVPSLVDDLNAAPDLAGARLFAPASVAYRGIHEPDMGDSAIRREVLMAAHEGSEHAEQAEQRGIGDATLEQLRADVTRLSREYMTGEPFPLFLEMRRVRNRMHDALDRRMWPRDATELYFLLGCINDLMAVAANNLGHPVAAEELIRAGWAYAVACDNHPLMARLRVEAATIAYWNQPARSRDFALAGLGYMADGPNAAYIHLKHGRAAARLGDSDTARHAITAAGEARERPHRDDLLEIGGEFNFSRASQHYLAGATLIEIPGAERVAATELERAIELYEAGPEPGEDHSQHSMMITRIDLSTALLRAGQVEGAVEVLEPVLALPPGRRISALAQRFARTRTELAQRVFRGSTQARDLEEQIEEFGSETASAGLHSYPGNPA
jgi:transcriptional regulator with XRE-family HTH domain